MKCSLKSVLFVVSACIAAGIATISVAQTKDQTILERRAMEMRKFNEKDPQKVSRTFQDTLKDIGFDHVNTEPDQRMGSAFGQKYRIVWYIKKDKTGNLVARVLLSKADRNIASEEDYKNFWNAIGQSKFLENTDYSPAELR